MSNERIDHAAEALSALEGAGDGGNFATDASVVALTHATLALVDQQKAANLIALGRPYVLPGGGTARIATWHPQTAQLHPDIAAALGLETRND